MLTWVPPWSLGRESYEAWAECFDLSDDEFRWCSPAYLAEGATGARDDRRMSINVKVIGGRLLIEHYVEALAEKQHLALESAAGLQPLGDSCSSRWTRATRNPQDAVQKAK